MANSIFCPPIFHSKNLRIAAIWITLALPGFSQVNTAPQATIAKAPTYDVVSIRPSKSGKGMQVAGKLDGFSAQNITLWGLIFNAYDVRPAYPAKGLPAWADSTKFDVEAKMDDSTFAALQSLPPEQQDERRRSMLQSLLADRFQLRVHHETAEHPVYELVVAKGGFKLKESQSSKMEGRVENGKIHYLSSPIASLVFTLSNEPDIGRLVLDKTGLTGHYDIILTWTSDDHAGSQDGGPSIFTALDEQLGLKLVAAEAPVDTLVVDHSELPSQN